MRVRCKKDLEILLESVPDYSKPKIELEQYITDSSIVSEIVWLSFMRGEISESKVADFGCGTGRFAIASALLGALQVVCVDVDYDAILDSKESVYRLDLDSKIDLVVCDVLKLPFRENLKFNVVFQNPPFGIQSRRGIDIAFLESSIKYSKIVYTIHKAETTNFIIRKIQDFGKHVDVLGYRSITIRAKYPHHYKRIHRVNVVILRIY